MLRLKHAPSPPGRVLSRQGSLAVPALTRLVLLTQVSQRVSVAQAIRAVAESVCCEGLSRAVREVAVLLDGRVRLRAERRRE